MPSYLHGSPLAVMHIRPFLAEDVCFPTVVDDQGLQLVGAGHVGHRHHCDPGLGTLATSAILVLEDQGLARL